MLPFSGRAGDNAVASFIRSLGDTRVLSREVELRLARIVAKGAALERAVVARQTALGRPLAPAEAAKLQVPAAAPACMRHLLSAKLQVLLPCMHACATCFPPACIRSVRRTCMPAFVAI